MHYSNVFLTYPKLFRNILTYIVIYLEFFFINMILKNFSPGCPINNGDWIFFEFLTLGVVFLEVINNSKKFWKITVLGYFANFE